VHMSVECCSSLCMMSLCWQQLHALQQLSSMPAHLTAASTHEQAQGYVDSGQPLQVNSFAAKTHEYSSCSTEIQAC
jgi:hypothetical protein